MHFCCFFLEWRFRRERSAYIFYGMMLVAFFIIFVCLLKFDAVSSLKNAFVMSVGMFLMFTRPNVKTNEFE